MTNEQLNKYVEYLIHSIEAAGEIGEFFELGPLGVLSPVGAGLSGLYGMADANNPAEQHRLVQKLLHDAQYDSAGQRSAQKLLHDAHLDQSHLLHKASLDPSGKESTQPTGSQHSPSQQRLAQKLLHDAQNDPAGQRSAQKLLHDAHLDQSHLLHKANLDPFGKESAQPLGSQHRVNQESHLNQHPTSQSAQKGHGHSLPNDLFTGPNSPSANAHSHHPLNSASSAHVGALALGSQHAHDIHGNNGKGYGAQIPLGGQMQLHSNSVTPPHPGSPHPQITPPQPVLDFVLQKMHAGQSGHLAPAPMSHGPGGNLRHDGLHVSASDKPHIAATPQKAGSQAVHKAGSEAVHKATAKAVDKAASQAIHKAASKAVHKAVADASAALKSAGHASIGGGLHPHAKHPVAAHHSAHHPHAGTMHHSSDHGQGTGQNDRGGGRGQYQGELRGTHKVLDAPARGTAASAHSQHPMKAFGAGLPAAIKQASGVYAPTQHINTMPEHRAEHGIGSQPGPAAHFDAHTHQGPVHQAAHVHPVHQQHPH